MRLKDLFKNFEETLKSAKHELKLLETDYLKTKKITIDFLNNCEKVGIKKVGIGTRDKTFKESNSFPFGYSGSVFADEKYEGWPAIWRAVEMTDKEHGIGRCCGNSGQYQTGTQFLENGIYEFKDGNWFLKNNE